jgi:two-component system, LytTR family, sensor kinase
MAIQKGHNNMTCYPPNLLESAKMKQRLYLTALIASPIIAVYGGSPFYIFDKIDLPTYFILIFGLTINVLLTFLIHIYFSYKFPNQNNYWRFISTYLVNVTFRIFFVFFDPIFKISEPKFAREYLSYPILTSFALNAIIMIIVNSIVIAYKKNETEQELQAIKLQHTEAQKQVLLQQLQPHFLFNSLSVLKSLIADSPNNAQEYVLRLSDFLRYSVQSANTEIVEIGKETQFVRDYIELQKVRFEEAFTFEIDIPSSFEKAFVPILSLQILVENIFKHNYFTEKNPLQFSIRIEQDFIVVRNTKVSIKLTPKSETGLANLNKRYELITNKSIVIEDVEDFFEVKIPIIYP